MDTETGCGLPSTCEKARLLIGAASWIWNSIGWILAAAVRALAWNAGRLLWEIVRESEISFVSLFIPLYWYLFVCLLQNYKKTRVDRTWRSCEGILCHVLIVFITIIGIYDQTLPIRNMLDYWINAINQRLS